jgi:hypothetical protein
LELFSHFYRSERREPSGAATRNGGPRCADFAAENTELALIASGRLTAGARRVNINKNKTMFHYLKRHEG